ncbi:hypothetical protein JB92DRAFT_813616 [Gautieria morchelliformis]|nr:hypothetical protein JB92DRAFT_813616 [Gautieria morchelliformis]
MTGCFAPTMPNLFGLAFVPDILTEVIPCLLMLYQAWITYKSDYGSRLLKILIRDSVLYFSSTFGVLLLNVLISFFTPRKYVQIGYGWLYAVPCTMGSHLLLSMLQQAFRELEYTSAFQSDTVWQFEQQLCSTCSKVLKKNKLRGLRESAV